MKSVSLNDLASGLENGCELIAVFNDQSVCLLVKSGSKHQVVMGEEESAPAFFESLNALEVFIQRVPAIKQFTLHLKSENSLNRGIAS